jgi:hypothetical protein
MFGWDGHHRWSWAAAPKSVNLLDIFLQEWIVTKIGAQPGKVIRIRQTNVVSMLDNHIPTHKAHLKSQNRGVLAIIRQNKFKRIAIGEPNKALAETHMTTFVDSNVTGKRFTKMGVEAFLTKARYAAVYRKGKRSSGEISWSREIVSYFV